MSDLIFTSKPSETRRRKTAYDIAVENGFQGNEQDYELYCHGLTVAQVTLYQRSETAPITYNQAGGAIATYTFASGRVDFYPTVTPVGTENPHTEGWYELSNNAFILTDDTSVVSGKTYYDKDTTSADWQTSPYTDDGDLYVIYASANSKDTFDIILPTEWSIPAIMSEEAAQGAPGNTVCIVPIYKASSTSPSSSMPTQISTYTFATKSISGLDNGWYIDPPNGDKVWISTALAISNEATAQIAANAWSSPTVWKEKGEKGETGETGATGADGVSVTSIVDKYAVNNSSSTPPSDPNAWKDFDDVKSQLDADHRFLWNREFVYYSDNTHDDLDAHVIYRFSTDGTNAKNIASVREYYAWGSELAPVSPADKTDQYWSTNWSTAPKYPSPVDGQLFVWQCEELVFTDSSVSALTTARIVASYVKDGNDADVFDLTVSSQTYVENLRLDPSQFSTIISVKVSLQGMYDSSEVSVKQVTDDTDIPLAYITKKNGTSISPAVSNTSVYNNDELEVTIPPNNDFPVTIAMGTITKVINCIDQTDYNHNWGPRESLPTYYVEYGKNNYPLTGDYFVAIKDFSPAATAIVPVGNENPKELGWYILSSGSYVLTTDTSVVQGTTYYNVVWRYLKGITYELSDNDWEEMASDGNTVKLLNSLTSLKNDPTISLSDISDANSVSWLTKLITDELISRIIKTLNLEIGEDSPNGGLYVHIASENDTIVYVVKYNGSEIFRINPDGNTKMKDATLDGEIRSGILDTFKTNESGPEYQASGGAIGSTSESTLKADGVLGSYVKASLQNVIQSNVGDSHTSLDAKNISNVDLNGRTASKVMRFTSVSSSQTTLSSQTTDNYYTAQDLPWTNTYPTDRKVYISTTPNSVTTQETYQEGVWARSDSGDTWSTRTPTQQPKPDNPEEGEYWSKISNVTYEYDESYGGYRYHYNYVTYVYVIRTETETNTYNGTVSIYLDNVLQNGKPSSLVVPSGSTIKVSYGAIGNSETEYYNTSRGTLTVSWKESENYSAGILFVNNASRSQSFYLSDLSDGVWTSMSLTLSAGSTFTWNLPMNTASAWTYPTGGSLPTLYKLVKFKWNDSHKPSTYSSYTTFDPTTNIAGKDMFGDSWTLGTINSISFDPNSLTIDSSIDNVSVNTSTYLREYSIVIKPITRPKGVFVENIFPQRDYADPEGGFDIGSNSSSLLRRVRNMYAQNIEAETVKGAVFN